jgi:DNA-binding XRE family transcriptional regulator
MLRGMPQHNQQNQQSKTSRSASNGKPHAELVLNLAQFRLDAGRTWQELADLCGINRTTLMSAVRRGTLSDRLAAGVERNLSRNKILQLVQVGAGRA